MKETTIGGYFMPREYIHTQQYKKELYELKRQGKTHREIAKILGLTQSKVKNTLNDKE